MHTLNLHIINKNSTLQDLTFSSSCISLIGKNASGKTTFLKKLALPTLHDIRLTFDGTDLSKLSISQRASIISWLPHCERISFNYKVMDFVLLGRYPVSKGISTKEDLSIASNYLEKLGVLDLSNRDVLSLSKGEYQKINIVRVLISQTPLMILDEPFSNLDISSIVSLVDILKSEAHENDSMIIASFHDVNIAQAFSKDSFLCINQEELRFYTELNPDILKETYGVNLRYVEGFYSIF